LVRIWYFRVVFLIILCYRFIPVVFFYISLQEGAVRSMDIRDISVLAKNSEQATRSAPRFSRRWVAVVGIDRYPSVKNRKVEVNPLDTAVKDALAVQEVLTGLYGFVPLMDPLVDRDANPSGFKELFRRLGDGGRVVPGDQVVVYFAGHGVEADDGSEGFWIPYLKDPSDYLDDYEWVSHSRVKRAVKRCSARQVLVVSDSCYAQKLTERDIEARDEGGGCVGAELYELCGKYNVRMVLTSGSREPVLDRGGGGHSVFCNHFLDLLRKYPNGCLPMGEASYARLRLEVERSAARLGRQQTPRLGYLTDDTLPFLLFRGLGADEVIDRKEIAQTEAAPVIEVVKEALWGSVGLTCNVDGAEIELGGERIFSEAGYRQVIQGIIAGRHKVVARKEGFCVWEGAVQVIADQRVDVHLEMLPDKPQSGALWQDPVLGMAFVFVEGGTFDMGDVFGDGFRDEKVHSVTLSDYWIGKYPVTFDEYDRYCEEKGKDKPDDEGWGRGRRPVMKVTWHDAVGFAEWLSKKTGERYRLPTEAEWEFAARSRGKKEKWSGTSKATDLGTYAWYSDNSGHRTHPVGEKKPNALGLYDMSGNVWEWCWDWYERSPKNNPQGSSSGSRRVYRGGSWGSGAGDCRSADRGGLVPGRADYGLGFRLAAVQP
jgi:formylglycine-generating enzyme required for sulfatase activity/uncharacterized caspase-like protein